MPATVASGVRILVALAALAGLSPADASTRGEAEQTLDEVMALLPGEYSSAPLVQLEELSGIAPEKRHALQQWLLARVDAPRVGRNVILQQVRANGELLYQRLYAFRIDGARQAVVVEVKPMVASADSVDVHRDAQLLEVVSDPAACDWIWRRRGASLVAELYQHGSDGAPCVARKDFNSRAAGAQWILNEEELWIRDDPDSNAGPQAGTYQRLYKARAFGCSWLATALQPPTTAFFELLDRGGEYRVDSDTGGGLILRLMRGPMPAERLRGQREVTALSVVSASSGRIHAESRMAGAPDYVTLRFADQMVECARR